MNKIPTIKYWILKTEWALLPKGSKPHSYGEFFSNDEDLDDKIKETKNRMQVSIKHNNIKINTNK